jgi:hypothetical protein
MGIQEHRALAHREFNATGLLHHRQVTLEAVRTLLSRIMEDPRHFNSHLRYMAGTIILAAAYGIDVQRSNDPYVEIADRAIRAFSIGARPGAYLVDAVPFLKYVPSFLPGAGFKRNAMKWRKDVKAMPEVTMDHVKRSMVSPPHFEVDIYKLLGSAGKRFCKTKYCLTPSASHGR